MWMLQKSVDVAYDETRGMQMFRRVLMTMGVMMVVGVVAVQAHENRVVGGYTVTVGFRVEPAFEDVVNAIDIFSESDQ
jgi:hypothetical protein